MELTPNEEQLINTLRQIDKENPLGIDNYTEETYIDFCLRCINSIPAEAGRRYRLFLAQSKEQPLIDITEAQRSKNRWDDVRARPEEKAEYERCYKTWNLPAPIWINDSSQSRARRSRSRT